MDTAATNGMQAVILAGGRGMRLRPMTDYLPKPLVPIKNIPLLEWQLRYLQKHNIRDVIVCAGYRTEQIADYLKSRDDSKIRVRLSEEKSPLGTGGAIKKAANLIRGKTFLVINGDVITNIDLAKLGEKINSVAAIPLRTKFGVMSLKGDRISSFAEKQDLSETFMNAGAYHLARDVLRDLPSKGDIEKTLFPAYAKSSRLYTVKFPDALWHSIDSFKDIEECSKQIHKISS